MDIRLKRRLVGAAVLMLLAVIFLPVLFEKGLQDEVNFDLPTEPFVPLQEPLPSAWVIDLGSFTDQQSAKILQGRLREAGFAAFVDKADSDQYRVKVGPMPDKSQAEADAAAVKRRLNLDAVITPYPD
ncbi:MAG: SPOR domain-containing protein [Methylohalobius sp.]